MNDKEENIEIEKLSQLLKTAPTDDGTFSGTVYDLYTLIGIIKGANSINQGDSITLEELDREMEAIYESSSRSFG